MSAQSKTLIEWTIMKLLISIGVWIHIEAEHTPEFNAAGNVISPDRLGTLINDLSRFLDVCAQYNVFAIPVLWNGALMRNQRYRNLVLEDARLDSYINNALIVSFNRNERK